MTLKCKHRISASACVFSNTVAADCFELGRQSYNSGDHYHTTLWMNEALNRYEVETNKTVAYPDILEYLAFSTYMQGNVRQALKLTDELLVERPDHQRAMGNRAYYVEALNLQQAKKRGEDSDTIDVEAVEKVWEILLWTKYGKYHTLIIYVYYK